MPFFIRNKNNSSGKPKNTSKTKFLKKRHLPSTPQNKSTPTKVKRPKLGSEEEEIPSDSDHESVDDLDAKKAVEESSSEDEETAQEKRLRLAKKYLSEIGEDTEKADDDEDVVGDRLKQDLRELSGRYQKSVSATYKQPTVDDILVCRGHKLSPTCLVVSPDDNHVYTASKDFSIIKWNAKTGKKVNVIQRAEKAEEGTIPKGHSSQILCLAITTDNQLLASGDRNKLIILWNPDTCQHVHTFYGHRDAISGLSFRRGSHQLFSASVDRSVKIFNADEMAYVDTLFGHQAAITAIDSLTRERAVTSGGSDGSIRVWKIIEESQLLFLGHGASIDCISLIDEEHFVSGASDNSLAIWSVMKKKPITVVRNAHPIDQNIADDGNWISSVTSMAHTDLLASGSKDGYVRLWNCTDDFRKLTLLMTIPMPGFVNGLKFSNDGSFLACAVGQEHRLGRWWTLKKAKNCLAIIRLPRTTE